MTRMNQVANSILRLVPVSWLEFASRNQWRVPRLRRLFAYGASLVKKRDGQILHGEGKGLWFNIANSHSGFLLGSHETDVQKILATVLRPGMAYYDIGANVGFFAVIAARMVGPQGRVICFEPLPDNAHQIDYNVRLNDFSNVSVRCEAAGGENRTEIFCTSAEPTWGKLATVGKSPDRALGEIRVPVRTLDSLYAKERLPMPAVLKIDVEGAETEVLAGALEMLRAARPLIVMELHGTNDAVTAILDRLGYAYGVLGSPVPVRDANWEAYIVASPRERPELMDVLKKFSGAVVA